MSKKLKLPIPKKSSKKSRQSRRRLIPTLDLHSLSLEGEPNPEIIINLAIDRFVRKYLYQEGLEIEIIVGRGINSNPSSFIENIPVLRYFTSLYLKKLQLSHSFYESNGVFIIRL